MTAILLLELLYTVIGGMVSVVITDYLQYVLLSVACIIVSILAVQRAGWHAIVSKVQLTMGSHGFNPITAPKFGLSFLIWQTLLWLAVHTCWQTTAMRMFSTKDADVSKRVMTWTGFIFLGRSMLPMLWGMAALTLYGTGALSNGVPAPVVDGHVLSPIEAMPAMLAHTLRSGVRGIVVAGMLAATMSVNSSYLLGWSSVISQDVIAPMRKQLGWRTLSSRGEMLVNRLASLGVGLFLLFWGLYYTPPGAVYLYLNITATIFLAGTFACITGGLYWRRANWVGAYMALLGGATGAIIPFFFLHRSESFSGFAAFGLAITGMIVGSLLSSSVRRRSALPVRESV
jgi:SSS family solute:Na+ symporter